jgi:recombinational DNA repair protein RecR
METRRSEVKQCKNCEAVIPDDARLCPHCREAQRHGDRLPQVFLVGVTVATAAAVLFESCPGVVFG